MNESWNPDLEEMKKKIFQKFSEPPPVDGSVAKSIIEKFSEDSSVSEKFKTPEQILQNYFIANTEHKKSQQLPVNPFAETEDYDAYHLIGLEEYQHNISNNSDKFDAIERNPNLGWKFHLNVIPENVIAVSEYLKESQFNHKYFSGGELEDGKVFTLYIGSHDLAKKLAKELSRDLQGKLARPNNHHEIEFASGVIGRFRGDKKYFTSYGPYGFSLREDYRISPAALSGLTGDAREAKYNEIAQQPALFSLRKLKNDYGKYFFSGE